MDFHLPCQPPRSPFGAGMVLVEHACNTNALGPGFSQREKGGWGRTFARCLAIPLPR